MKIDVESLSNSIIENVGGISNISMVTHCVTRLRFVLKDQNIVKTENLKSLKGVLDVVFASGQCQVILGENLFLVFDYISNNYDLDTGEAIEEVHNEDYDLKGNEKHGFKYYFNKVIQFLASSLAPFVTVLYGAGMLRVFMVLIGYFWPAVTSNTTYMMFDFLSQTPFYFMPVFVAYGAAKTLKSNPAFAICIACALLYPDFMALVGGNTSVTMFSIPVVLVKYSTTLLPAIFGTLLVWKLEKFFYRIIPGVLRSVFAPLCTLAIAFPIEMIILAPLGTIVGQGVVAIFMGIYNLSNGLAVGVLAAIQCYLVLGGMNMLLVAPMLEVMGSLGYDPVFRAGWILHNVAEGGACLGVALKTKNKELKSDALSACIGATLSGVSEPAIYGINVKLKKPFLAVTAGGLVGGCVAGFMGVKAYSMGYSSVLGVVLFGDTILAIIAGIVAAFLVATITMLVTGFEDIPEKN